MRVPFFDLQGVYAAQQGEIEAAMARVLASQAFILGPEVRAFEEEMGAYLGGGVTALGCASGSDALLLAMLALDVGPGDEIILPSYSFFATASCVTRLGATPVWVDVEEDTFNLDPEAVARKMSRRTKAIIPVHLFGRCAALHALPEELCVVEDAAQSLGAEIDGSRAGSVGEIACLSFFPTKNLGCFGDGGMVVARDPTVASRLDALRRHGAARRYYHDEVGINSRLDALQAAILRVRLRALPSWIQTRRRNADRYRALFAATALDGEVIMPVGDGERGIWHTYNQFVIRARRRDELRTHLADCGVGTAVYYPLPLHLQACFSDFGGRPGDCPVAERLCGEALALPIFPGLTEDQQGYLVESVVSFYAGRP
jgi:dTDP-4-amino-4,6-dideoxygalactose transaminase